MEIIKHNGLTIEVHVDENARNPREEWDNLGTMVCFHKRYSLGDKKHDISSGDFNSWEEMKKHLINKKDAAVILPLFLYDHSGITMYTTGDKRIFQHEAWDSGQVGFIYVSKAKVREEFSVKRISKQQKVVVETCLRGEIKIYDEYLIGDVYGYKAKDENDEEIDACWGYYGSDHEQSGLLEAARAEIDGHIKHKTAEV